MLNAMVKFKMVSLPDLLAKQEVPAYSCPYLFVLYRFLTKGLSQDAEHYGEAQNVVTSCFASQYGSGSIFLPVIN